jgi:hypothetical protein
MFLGLLAKSRQADSIDIAVANILDRLTDPGSQKSIRFLKEGVVINEQVGAIIPLLAVSHLKTNPAGSQIGNFDLS